ncbi:DUF4302 domain-containing protein [Arcticibacter sp. MXS-1]|uniref:DUF4302 domain-containing protein n=1 Tax=Arcticibacter sp. MXS-1 TaxID=3341726 RepID=UPI0035A95B47
MKKTLFFIYLILMAAAVGCKKDDDLSLDVEKSFKNPAESLADFKKAIGGSASGWKVLLSHHSGRIFSGFMSLDTTKKELQLYMDFDGETAATASKSAFKIDLLQNTAPTITLEAGSHLDSLEDAGIDKDYSMRSVKGDTVSLVGARFADEIRLVKATAPEQAVFTSGGFASQIGDIEAYLESAVFLYAALDNQSVAQLLINPVDVNLTSAVLSSSKGVSTASSFYSYSAGGITMKSPIMAGDTKVTELGWDAAAGKLYFNYKGAKLFLENSLVPVIGAEYLLGTAGYSLFSVPSPTLLALPGWSAGFRTVWNTASAAITARGFTLYVVEFNIDPVSSVMNMDVYFLRGSTRYQARFPYSYSKSGEGVYKFTALPLEETTTGSNASFMSAQLKPLTDLMSTGSYKVQTYPLRGNTLILGQFVSVETPGIYFTGILDKLF